jgi:hypothetical protein
MRNFGSGSGSVRQFNFDSSALGSGSTTLPQRQGVSIVPFSLVIDIIIFLQGFFITDANSWQNFPAGSEDKLAAEEKSRTPSYFLSF